MGVASQLYQLQLVDIERDAKSARLAEVTAGLRVTDEVDRASQAVSETEGALERLGIRLRALELEVGGLNAKLKANQERLYSGKVRSPKELSGLQDEATVLGRRRSELEDDQLELMIAIEEEEAELAERQARLRQIESTWHEQQEALKAEKEQLEFNLLELGEQRDSMRALIGAAELSDYDGLRNRVGGSAVALLRQGACQGCGVDVPTGMAQAARRGEGLHHCPISGRLLLGVG